MNNEGAGRGHVSGSRMPTGTNVDIGDQTHCLKDKCLFLYKNICLYDRRRAPMLKPQITPFNIPYEQEAMDAHHNRGGDLAVQRLQNLPQSLYAPLGCVGEHAAVWTDLGWLKPCSLHLHSPDGEAQQLCWHLPQSERHTITQCTRTGIMRTHTLWINRSVVLKHLVVVVVPYLLVGRVS